MSVVKTKLPVTDSVLIGGQRHQVQKIMTFQDGWIEENWGEPFKLGCKNRSLLSRIFFLPNSVMRHTRNTCKEFECLKVQVCISNNDTLIFYWSAFQIR